MSSQGSSAGSHAPVDRDKKRKEVGALLRSCLMSSKGGVPLETVNRKSMLCLYLIKVDDLMSVLTGHGFMANLL